MRSPESNQSASTILYLGTVWPEPQSSAAGLRTYALMDDFAEMGYSIHFVSPSKEKNEFMEQLQNRGILTQSFQPNDSSFDAYVKVLAPQIVVYDRFILEEQFGWRVKEQCPDTLQVLDLQDLHSLRRSRMAAHDRGVAQDKIDHADLDLLTEDAMRELASIFRCDLTLVISPFEEKLLLEKFKVPPRLLLGLGYSFPEALSVTPPYPERKNVAMIGNFRHPPNRDAVFWLHQEIWPKIREQLPDCEIHLYGAYPPKEIMALDEPQKGFRVMGQTPNSIETLSRYRLSLAPLRFGAGIKGKVADSWRAQTPVVTTPIGAEGMENHGEFAGVVANGASELIQAVMSLYVDQKLFDRFQKQGADALKQLYDISQNRQKLRSRLDIHLAHRQELRRENVIGQMLAHQSMRSTKYFSKWIELKESIKAQSVDNQK